MAERLQLSGRRIELQADMKRTAMDCRLEFAYTDDPAGSLVDALLDICPDATAAELRDVIKRAAKDLFAELKRLGCWRFGNETQSPLAAWAVRARGRITDLVTAYHAVDLFLEELAGWQEGTFNFLFEGLPVVYKPRKLRADSPEQLARDPAIVRRELRCAIARCRPPRSNGGNRR